MSSADQVRVPNNKSIQELHKKSLEWLSLAEFWKTELSFFYHLLRKKELDTDSEYNERIVKNFQKGWFSLDSDLSEVTTAVQQYENHLSDLSKSKLEEMDENLESEHREYKSMISHFSFEFRSYKKVLFVFAERHW